MVDLDALHYAWKEFTNNQNLLPSVDPLVAESWRRCQLRLNPNQVVDPSKLGKDHLLAAQVTSFPLLSIARPVMEDIYQYVENSDTAVLLVNPTGYILDMIGDGTMLKAAEEHMLNIGVLVSEGSIGTNAFSLALLDRVPARVVGAEHYLRQFHELAEVAAPIFEVTGRRLGALGILSHATNFHPHTLGLAVAGARAIEGQRQTDILMAEQNSHLAELNTILASISEGILVWNSQGVLMHANTAATDILQLPASTIVGRQVNEFISLPPFVKRAIRAKESITDVEAILTIGQTTISCMVSLRFARNTGDMFWIIATLRQAEKVRQLVQHQVAAQVSFSIDDFQGESPATRQIRRLAKKAAPAKASILIRGESGTGKNFLARAIHNDSPRREAPFILYNCASVPNQLVISELLGFEAGASKTMVDGRPSKFELAHSGTLFLQEIDALPLEAQSALLNVIELGIVQRLSSSRPIKVDIRIIASTSVDLEKLVAEGNFRADLYYRLSPFEIFISPLRERPDDLPVLVNQILKRLSQRHNRPLMLAPGALDLMRSYSWPGNMRELETVLERAVIQAGISQVVGPMHLPEFVRRSSGVPKVHVSMPRVQSLAAVEREAIVQAARQCNGNVTQMARVLGIGRTTIWRKMKGINIALDEFRQRPTDSAA